MLVLGQCEECQCLGHAVRDLRGFALMVYTEEGNRDMVGNNSQESR